MADAEWINSWSSKVNGFGEGDVIAEPSEGGIVEERSEDEVVEEPSEAVAAERLEVEEAVQRFRDFRKTVLKNVERLAEVIQEYDAPIVKHLIDFTFEVTTKPVVIKYFFHFSPNEYFNNSVLTKTYETNIEDPLSFVGHPEITNCKGCDIDWNKGKNATVRVVRQRQKHTKTGAIRWVNRTKQISSFFNFFKEEEEDIDDDDNEIYRCIIRELLKGSSAPDNWEDCDYRSEDNYAPKQNKPPESPIKKRRCWRKRLLAFLRCHTCR